MLCCRATGDRVTINDVLQTSNSPHCPVSHMLNQSHLVLINIFHILAFPKLRCFFSMMVFQLQLAAFFFHSSWHIKNDASYSQWHLRLEEMELIFQYLVCKVLYKESWSLERSAQHMWISRGRLIWHPDLAVARHTVNYQLKSYP